MIIEVNMMYKEYNEYKVYRNGKVFCKYTDEPVKPVKLGDTLYIISKDAISLHRLMNNLFDLNYRVIKHPTKNYSRYIINEDASSIIDMVNGRYIKHRPHRGRSRCNLKDNNNSKNSESVHMLIAWTWLNYDSGSLRFKDGNAYNIHYSNLYKR